MTQTADPRTVDAVTVEVVRNAFLSIARQMSQNLFRSAYTPIIYEMKDCSVGVFDRRGRLLGQSSGLPMFLGNLELGISATTATIGGAENYRPGDVYMVNDPYLVGSHTNDVNILAPFFLDDELIGFGATKAHWLDIGAKDAGRPVDTFEIYQEGYRFGPTAVYRAGEPVREVIDFLMRNSRLPRSIWGDLHAQISACRTGEGRMVDLHRRYGSAVLEAATEEIFAQCERLDRAAVGAVPDGVYHAEGSMDSAGPGLPPVRVVVTVTVAGDQISIDLTGSSPPTAGSVNAPYPGTLAGARLAYKCLVNPNMPVTDGTFRNLEVIAPDDTVFNVSEPHGTIYYYPPVGLMIDLVIRAMAEAAPELVIAGQAADPMNVNFVGKASNGRGFIAGSATAVGWGASATTDGINGLINYGAGDLKNMPVEVFEARYPMMVLQYGLRPDSGGAGRQRGGLGITRQYETLADDVTLTLWLERGDNRPWGLMGGHSGAPTNAVLTEHGVPEKVLKTPPRKLAKGSTLLVETAGGGGFGPPEDRDPRQVADDLADGYCSSWQWHASQEGS